MASPDMNTRVKEALDRTAILALSTIGPDGSWTCPVHYTYDDKFNLYFTSMMDSKHVQNILKDPRVSCAIYSVPGPPGGNLGLQLKGTAELVPAELPVKHEQGSGQKFKIIPEEVWCFDSRVIRERQRVDLSGLQLT